MATQVETVQKVPDEPAPPVAGRKRTIALLVILFGLLVDLLDITIVNVALPSIQEGAGTDAAAVQWVVAGYSLAFALLLITSARLGDAFGRKRLWLIGMVGFTLASLAAGVSQTADQLVVARFVQGAFGALMVPQVLSIIQVMYAPHERGKAFTVLSGVFGIGTVGGPLVGAALTDANFFGLGWRSIFLVNVPLGIFAFFAAVATVPESKVENARRLDIPGVIILTAALFLLVYPVVEGRELDYPPWTFASMAASVVLFVVFVLYERRRRVAPLVPMHLFKYRSVNGGLLVSIFFMGGVMPFFLVNTLYLQVGQGFSIIKAGLTGIIWGACVPLFGALSSRWVTPKLGRFGLQLGLIAMALGMAVLLWTVSTVENVTILHLFPGLFIGGAGMGLTFPPIVSYTLRDVPVDDAGPASGVYNTVQQVSSVLGIAGCGVLFFSLLALQARPSVDEITPQLRAEVAAAGVSAADSDRVVDGFRDCFIGRMRSADLNLRPQVCIDSVTGAGLTADEAQRISAIMAPELREAMRLDYQRATQWTLVYQIGFFVAGFFCAYLLPRR